MPATRGQNARDVLDLHAPQASSTQEFYAQVTRPSRTNAPQQDVAVGLIRTWFRFRIQEAPALGCRELLSEDMAHGREIDGVRILDPFR